MNKSKIFTSEPLPPTTGNVLGVFEGECADANITNNNGLDITVPVWQEVFDSDIFKQGIENGWYIGFLGHPEDPGCMDFRHGCIIMIEGYIDEDGKVYGKFNLIDTPVGRIVKSLIDAGVKFGISVRGAGDIENNSVTPSTFDFRGFDLVAFPAYPDAIPEFTPIAASTDAEKQKQYKAVCAALKTNLQDVDSKASLDILKSQFAPQSQEYADIECRYQELENCDVDIKDQKLMSMTQLYLDAIETCDRLTAENKDLQDELYRCSVKASRKLASMQRIVSDQISTLTDAATTAENRCKTLISASKRMKQELSDLKQSNLVYSQKINASNDIIRRKDATISDLRKRISETVTASTRLDQKTSNLDAKVNSLRSKLAQTQKLLADYQSAYVGLYCSAIGIDPNSVSITGNTPIDDLKQKINQVQSDTVHTSISDDPIPVDVDDSYDSDLITL